MTPLAPARFQHRSLVEYAALLAVLALVATSLAATAPRWTSWAAASPGCSRPQAC